jgi:acyl carrier protein
VSAEEITRARVRAIVGSRAPLKVDGVTSELALVGQLGFDSLGLIELAAALEEEFRIPPQPDEDLLEIESVGDVEEMVMRLAGQRTDMAC